MPSLVVVVVVGSVLAVRSTSALVTDDLIVSYSFPRSECLEGAFQSDDGLALFGPLRTYDTTCPSGDGVENVNDGGPVTTWKVVSDKNASAFNAMMAESVASGSDGFSIELWWKRGAGRRRTFRPLVSMSATGPGSTYCSEISGFRLSEYDVGYLAFWFWDEDGATAAACTELYLETTPSALDFAGSSYIHLALVVGNDIDIYVNSLLFYSKSFLRERRPYDSIRYDRWDPSYKLQLFSDGRSRQRQFSEGEGVIHALRIYSRRLTVNDVGSNYFERLPNSRPVVSNTKVVLNEDGQRENETEKIAAELYGAELPIWALARIALAAVDEDDLEEHPNQRFAEIRARPMRVFVDDTSSLKAQVLTSNGSLLGDGDEVPREEDGSYVVLIRPPLNSYDDVVNVSFWAVDGVTGLRSEDVAVASVTIVPVNDPPIGIVNNVTRVVRAATTEILALEASDVDGDAIVGFYVVSIPQNATLRRVLSANSTVVGAPLEVGAYVPGLEVAFNYVVPAKKTVDGVYDRVAFSFEPVDEHGAVGATSVVEVLVTTNIFTFQKTSTLLQNFEEERTANVSLYAMDSSDARLEVCLDILDVRPPSSQLYDIDGSQLFAGNTVKTRINKDLYDSGAKVFYAAPPNLFTTPTTRWNASTLKLETAAIDFVAYACDFREVRSIDATQLVPIVNVADPADVFIEPREFSVYAYSATAHEDFPMVLDLRQEALLVVSDADRDVDALRVDVSCKHGLVSLDHDLLHLADFNSDTYCQDEELAWTCEGSGTDDRAMTFVATPSDAGRLLSTITYYSLRPNVNDVVAITLYDGADDSQQTGCLSESQYKTYSVRTRCAVATTTFVVHVDNFASVVAGNSESSDSFSWQLLVGVLCFTLVLCCGGCRCALRARRRRARKRRKATRAACEVRTTTSDFFDEEKHYAHNLLWVRNKGADAMARCSRMLTGEETPPPPGLPASPTTPNALVEKARI